MTKPLEEIADYPSLQNWLKEHCEVSGIPGWHNYGPADMDRYLADPVKILLVNSESGGYETTPNTPVNEYLVWIKNRHKAPRIGSVLVAIIRRYITLLETSHAVPAFDKAQTSKIYYGDERLNTLMTGTSYMNARITSNGTGSSREDKAGIQLDMKRFNVYRRKLVEILKPRIIICGGESARNSIFRDDGPFPKSALQTRIGVFVVRDCIIVVTPHLSRISQCGGYEGFHRIASKAASIYVETYRADRPNPDNSATFGSSGFSA